DRICSTSWPSWGRKKVFNASKREYPYCPHEKSVTKHGSSRPILGICLYFQPLTLNPIAMANFFLIPLIFVGLIILFKFFFIVKQQTAVTIERFGRFHSIRHSGLQMKIPLVDRIAGRLTLKRQQLDVVVETKTLDDVFVKLKISVQFVVIRDKVYDAFYKLEYPHDQITSYVFDVVRAEVPKMKLDDVFVKKDDIAIAVKAE